MHLKLSSAKWQPFCPGGDKLTGSAASDPLISVQRDPHHSKCQGSFCVLVQPMRVDVTLLRHLSLAEPIHRMIPECATRTGVHYSIIFITFIYYSYLIKKNILLCSFIIPVKYFMKISPFSHPNCLQVIAIKFFTCPDICAIMLCAIVCNGLITRNWTIIKNILHRTELFSEKVRWAPRTIPCNKGHKSELTEWTLFNSFCWYQVQHYQWSEKCILQHYVAVPIGFGDYTSLLWWNNINN